jgi:hypothetical protein
MIRTREEGGFGKMAQRNRPSPLAKPAEDNSSCESMPQEGTGIPTRNGKAGRSLFQAPPKQSKVKLGMVGRRDPDDFESG